jgi:hypothetical protein
VCMGPSPSAILVFKSINEHHWLCPTCNASRREVSLPFEESLENKSRCGWRTLINLIEFVELHTRVARRRL